MTTEEQAAKQAESMNVSDVERAIRQRHQESTARLARLRASRKTINEQIAEEVRALKDLDKLVGAFTRLHKQQDDAS